MSFFLIVFGIVVAILFLRAFMKSNAIINIHENSLKEAEKTGLMDKIRIGNFKVTGYTYLDSEGKIQVDSYLKIGSMIDLYPSPIKSKDSTAIMVEYNGVQIGWMDSKYEYKNYLFSFLIIGTKINAKVISIENYPYKHIIASYEVKNINT